MYGSSHVMKRLKRIGRQFLIWIPGLILARITDFGKKLIDDRVIGGTNHLLDQHGGKFMSLTAEAIAYLVRTPLAISELVLLAFVLFVILEEVMNRYREHSRQKQLEKGIAEEIEVEKGFWASMKDAALIGSGVFVVVWVVAIWVGSQNRPASQIAAVPPLIVSTPTLAPAPAPSGNSSIPAVQGRKVSVKPKPTPQKPSEPMPPEQPPPVAPALASPPSSPTVQPVSASGGNAIPGTCQNFQDGICNAAPYFGAQQFNDNRQYGALQPAPNVVNLTTKVLPAIPPPDVSDPTRSESNQAILRMNLGNLCAGA